jgi:hypothetical protein
MGRTFREVLMSVGAVGVLLLTLISFDDRVREQVALRLRSEPTAELARAGREVRNLTSVLVEAARRQSLDRAPVLIFVFAAGVLFFFMIRT